jgi:hypothetical protein
LIHVVEVRDPQIVEHQHATRERDSLDMWISVARAKSSGPVPARAIADPAGLQSDETPAV